MSGGKVGRQVPIPTTRPWCPECDWKNYPSVAPMPAMIPKHGDKGRVVTARSVSGGQMRRTWDRGRGLSKSPPVYRGVTGEAHTCLMQEAGGERCDGARVRESSHLG